MIAARLKSNGMFLKRFSGSYNHRLWSSQYNIEKRKNPGKKKWVDAGFIRATKEEVLNDIFCESSLQNAKLYSNEQGAKMSMSGHFPLVDLVSVSIQQQET